MVFKPLQSVAKWAGALCIGVLLACRSVGPIQDLSAALEELPALRFTAISGGSEQSAGAVDFRLREAPREITQLSLLPLRDSVDGDLSEGARTILMLRLERALRNSAKARFTMLPPGAAPDSEETRAQLRQEESDALLVPRVELAEGARRGELVVAFLDAFNGQQLSELRVAFELEPPASDANRVDLAGSASGYRILEMQSSGGIKVGAIDAAALNSCISATVSGTLTALSTSGDTEVILLRGNERKSLGSAPVRAYALREGKVRLLMRRNGQPEQSFALQIRAGQGSLAAATWPDEGGATDLAILSSPANLRIAVDGQLRGQTPLYLTDIQPGSYRLELSQSREQGSAIVQAEGAVQAGVGGAARAFFIYLSETFQSPLANGDLWSLAAQEGAVSLQTGEGLGFRGEGASGGAWLGLATQSAILEDKFDAEIDLLESEGGVLLAGLYNPRGASLMLQMRGASFTLQRFALGRPEGAALAFAPLRQREDHLHRLRFQFDKNAQLIQVFLDGDEIYSGPWSAGEARLALLSRGGSADGRRLVKRLRIRTGAGLNQDRE